MQAGRRAQVTSVSSEDSKRAAYANQTGLLVRRLNVAWKPEMGAMWSLRFDDGCEVAFSEAEIAEVSPDGSLHPNVATTATWGVAPRTVSYPFRKFGQGNRPASTILASLILVVAGVLLTAGGIVSGNAVMVVGGVILAILSAGAAIAAVS